MTLSSNLRQSSSDTAPRPGIERPKYRSTTSIGWPRAPAHFIRAGAHPARARTAAAVRAKRVTGGRSSRLAQYGIEQPGAAIRHRPPRVAYLLLEARPHDDVNAEHRRTGRIGRDAGALHVRFGQRGLGVVDPFLHLKADRFQHFPRFLLRTQEADFRPIGPHHREVDVAAGAAGDVLDREPAAWLQHTKRLGIEAGAILDV